MAEAIDERLADIATDVHEIRLSVKDLHSRQDRADTRLTDLEEKVIYVKAEQAATEKVMTIEHVRMHEKIDGISRVLVDHTRTEDADRAALLETTKKQVFMLMSTLASVLGLLGWWIFEHVAGK